VFEHDLDNGERPGVCISPFRAERPGRRRFPKLPPHSGTLLPIAFAVGIDNDRGRADNPGCNDRYRRDYRQANQVRLEPVGKRNCGGKQTRQTTLVIAVHQNGFVGHRWALRCQDTPIDLWRGWLWVTRNGLLSFDPNQTESRRDGSNPRKPRRARGEP
jgi:hypothetical protein